MKTEIREDMLWALDTFIINLREQFELLEADQQSGATDAEFFDRVQHMSNWLVTGFQTDINEMLDEALDIKAE